MAPSLQQITPKVPVARLCTISLAKLMANNVEESKKMQECFERDGFLYLSLQGVGSIADDWDAIGTFMEDYFDQPLQAKMKDSCASDTIGYEPCGTSAGVFGEQVDGYESLKISKAQLDSTASSTVGSLLAGVVEPNVALFQRFVRHAHEATITILRRLSPLFPDAVPFEAAHDTAHTSLSTLAMFRYPRQDPTSGNTRASSSAAAAAGHNKHTDLGTLTFLLTRQWGLQVLQPSEGAPGRDVWSYVQPRPGHAIINVGDSLRFLANNRLKSAVHRVVPVSGLDSSGFPPVHDLDTDSGALARQGENRHSLIYFLRPADTTHYRTSDGKTCTAREWHDEKFNMFRQPRSVQDSLGIHTGGMEQHDQLLRLPVPKA